MAFIAMTNEKNENTLIQLQKLLLDKNTPFVSYRLPDEAEVITQIQYKSQPVEIDFSTFDYSQSGFILSPFSVSENSKSWFLKPDIVMKNNHIPENLFKDITENSVFFTKNQENQNLQTTSEEDFCNYVNAAIQDIKAGKLRKVVLSKVRKQEDPADFNAATFFHTLCKKYPHAMVYLLQMPGAGCWMGATPEPLIQLDGTQAHTISLAGTQLASEKPLVAYNWTQKEIEEQQIVTEFVENSLHESGFTNIFKKGPANHQAANLIHLKTEFRFDIGHENCTGEIIKTLHPTPSVGGLPKAEAHDFIATYEKHDRTYYTGFLGPVNVGAQTNIFVNLRCLQLFGNEFVLYSGAGITASSVAQNEWIETDNKMLTMLNAMRTSKPLIPATAGKL